MGVSKGARHVLRAYRGDMMVRWPWTKRTRRSIENQRLHEKGPEFLDKEENLEDRNEQPVRLMEAAERGSKQRRKRSK